MVVGQKGKKPPSFIHFPRDRAKKLKKAWVEKAKIKSKWKAQKRREGFATNQPRNIPADDNNDEGEQEDVGEQDLDEQPAQEHFEDVFESLAPAQESEEDSSDAASTHAEGTSRSPVLKPTRDRQGDRKPKPFPRNNRHIDRNPQKNDEQQQRSLRSLFSEAYSTSSLHTHKSHPLKDKRKATRGEYKPKGPAVRGHASVRGDGKPKGQPNMKLRMNAMLEKIKRDYT